MGRRFTLLVISMLLGALGWAQENLSLANCIEYALANHPEVRVAQLSMKDADWQIRENRSIAYPQLTLGINAQRYLIQPALPAEALGFGEPGQKIKFALKNNIAGSLGISQLMYNSSYIASIKGAKMYRDYINLQLNAVKEKVRNRVTDAYLPALVVTESIEVLDKNIENQERMFRETKATYAAGFIEQLDVDRVEYVLSTLRTERESLARQKEIVIDALKFAMGKSIGDEITLSDDIDRLLVMYGDIDPEASLDYMNRPEYVTLLKARELSQVQVEVYQKDWLPTLSFFGSYNPSFQGNEKLFWIPSSIIGLQLNMPIYDGGMSRAKEERAVIAAMKVDEQKKMLTQAYDTQVEAARKQYNNAKLKLTDLEHNLALAQRIHETSEAKFKQGVGSSFEVTQALMGYFQAQGMYIKARYDYLNSIIGLRQALGITSNE